MEAVSRLVPALAAKNTKAGCAALNQLLRLSESEAEVSLYLPHFFTMLESPNSYLRTRGFLLIAANARWDKDGFIDSRLPQCIALIQDEKPITARQCIQALPALVRAKPHLTNVVRKALEQADFSAYPDSMRPLLEKDRADALSTLAPE